MSLTIPQLGEDLNQNQIDFLSSFAKACRLTTIAMLKQSQSGHPGGSLSAMDYLSTLYALIVSQTGENVIVSNGHISPAVYSVLAELGYVNKQDVINTFRKIGSNFEGHITRHVPGVVFGTGPLGVGVSVAAGFALADQLKSSDKFTFGVMGDGEAQEGQVYEMLHFGNKFKLNKFILFVDYNQVQLTGSLAEVMPIDLDATFKAANWHVLNCDGHDYQAIWQTLRAATQVQDKPIVIIGKTIMGKGVDFMEAEGRALKATWHGNAPKPEQADLAIAALQPTEVETALLEEFKPLVTWHPSKFAPKDQLSDTGINIGEPKVYTSEDNVANRNAYGNALLDLAKRNPKILAMTADLRGSVMTAGVAKELPAQHVECGIAEQHMVSAAGGLSLNGFVPFASSFGAFLSSRAKDQARVNDINLTNVKLVATHCGLSVGEDGPTHQAIDDMGSFLGLLNTMVIEPADPNQTDRVIRFIASHFGNFYIRMGRHAYPIVTKVDGSPFYNAKYEYYYGRCDVLREGKDLTIAASGAMVNEALKALSILNETNPKLAIEVVAVSSIKKLDQPLINSIKKTKRLITVEDHNTQSGLGSQIARYLALHNIQLKEFEMMGVNKYQLSGKVHELYKAAGIDAESIAKNCEEILV